MELWENGRLRTLLDNKSVCCKCFAKRRVQSKERGIIAIIFVNAYSVGKMLYVEKTIYDTADATLVGAEDVKKALKRVSKMV